MPRADICPAFCCQRWQKGASGLDMGGGGDVGGEKRKCAMSLVPEGKSARIEFYERRVTQWESNAVAIGLTVAEAQQLALRTIDARAAELAAQQARDVARAATLQSNVAFAAMSRAGAEAIRRIRVKAEAGGGDPNVYALAQIPPPKTPGPVPPPGSPYEFRVELLSTGAITLTWKCDNPPSSVGTIYEVRRRATTGTAPFAYVGAAGTREFTDDTIPAGTTAVTYEITAARSTRRGTPSQFNVTFGRVGTTGVASVSVEEVAPPAKLAA